MSRTRRILPRHRWFGCALLPLLFAGTCTALLPLGMTIADPMTHRTLSSIPHMRFPVIVMTGATPRVVFLENFRQIPQLSAGSSYLIPRGRERAIQIAINERHPRGTEGGWVLQVQHLTPERQRIELFWLNDGVPGGAYEATRASISPLYRKITGPGFAFIFGGIALLMNATIWALLLFAIHWCRKNKLAVSLSTNPVSERIPE